MERPKHTNPDPLPDTPLFDTLGLSETMMGALAEAGYTHPTPVQAGVIPHALDGADILAQARTGTGKTAAFAIPILEQLQLKRSSPHPEALILAPTRELAVQVRDEVTKLSHGRKMHCVALYGGKPVRGQIAKLQRGSHVIVGTPGRVLDHLGRGSLQTQDIRFVVLDEADRMLDIGFRPDIEKILRRCPKQRQTMLLSATVPPPIERLARKYMDDPVKLDLSPTEISGETIDQYYFTVEHNDKYDLLTKLLKREDPQQAIIFCRTKRGTDRLHQRLSKQYPDAGCIHGDMQQRIRDRVMKSFRDGRTRILVATDVVGRGIDVTGISHIINFDIPQFCDDYVHRVGRTGRMGREGVAYTFVSAEEGNELTRIEMRIDRLLQRDEITLDGPARGSGRNDSSGDTPDKPETAKPRRQPNEEGPRALQSVTPENPPPEPPSRRKKKYRRAL